MGIMQYKMQEIRLCKIQFRIWQNFKNQNGLIVVPGIANQNANHNKNGNVVAVRTEVTLKRLKKSMRTSSSTQADNAPVYDSDGLAEDHKKQQSLYNGRVLLEKHDPPAVYDLEKTLQLAQETDESLNRNKVLEYKNERLLRVDVSQDIMSIVQNNSVVGCSKHMTGNLKLLINFIWKFLGIVRFGNGHLTAILVADNVNDILFDENTFKNPFASPSTSAGESSSSQYVDPSNMHMFYQPYQHEYQWTRDHPLEDVCVCQPEGFIDVDHPSHVYKLKKALYGFKQALRAWYAQLLRFLLKNHFTKGTIDPTLFIRRFNNDILVVQVYVDDIILEWNLMIPLVPQWRQKNKIDLDQNETPVDAMKYRSMIGALMYLTSSRPDIVQATCLCVRYQAQPTEKHLKEVKRILLYLWRTVNIGLWYTKDSGLELTRFLDAYHTGCQDTIKRNPGETQFLGEKLVSWPSKKLDYMALSTAEA
nr:hypothetical protein [Tanacetum cinerariifolium]